MEILNRAALAQLEEDTSAEIVPVILTRFLEELARRCADLSEALQSADLRRVGLEAHSIKSAAKTFGLERLSAQALELESLADAAREEAVRGAAEALVQTAEQSRTALEAFLAGAG